MVDRLLSILVALSMACLVWLYARSRDQEMLDNVPVPVSISLAPGEEEFYDLEISGPAQVPVSFLGPPSRVRELRNILQRGELRVEIQIAAPRDRGDESRILDTVHVEATDIHPPAGVVPIVAEGRNRIPVTLFRLVERRLNVRFESPRTSPIVQTKTEPASVLVRAPVDLLDRVQEIPTQPFSIPDHGLGTTRPESMVFDTVPLVKELEGHHLRTTPDHVAVRVTFQLQQKLYELTEVPVQFLCPPNFNLRPLFGDERTGKMNLRLQGPAGEETPGISAYVDLCGRKWEPGLYEEPVKLQLPREFKLAQNPPRAVAFQLVPADPAPRVTSTPPP